MVFIAETMLCYANCKINKEGVIILTHDEKIQDVDKQKRYFINFCNARIVDIRLKDMAVSGVQYKKHFNDIMEWQQKMNERIFMIIEIAENDIKEKFNWTY